VSEEKLNTIIELLKNMKDLLIEYSSTIDSLDKRLSRLEERFEKPSNPAEKLEDSLDVEDIKKKLSEISDKLERVRKSLYWHRISTEKTKYTVSRKGYRKHRGSRVSEQ